MIFSGLRRMKIRMRFFYQIVLPHEAMSSTMHKKYYEILHSLVLWSLGPSIHQRIYRRRRILKLPSQMVI